MKIHSFFKNLIHYICKTKFLILFTIIKHKINELVDFQGIENFLWWMSLHFLHFVTLFDFVSYTNPYLNGNSIAGGTIFDNFFLANPPGVALRSFVPFTDEPNDWKYLVGDMNVLFGDGSVSKKDAAWLCNNRFKISLDSKE